MLQDKGVSGRSKKGKRVKTAVVQCGVGSPPFGKGAWNWLDKKKKRKGGGSWTGKGSDPSHAEPSDAGQREDDEGKESQKLRRSVV